MRRLLVTALAVVPVVASTTPGTTPGTAPAATDPAGSACAFAEQSSPTVVGEIPDSPAGEQLRWVLEDGPSATASDIEEHFSPEFLAQVPADQMVGLLGEFGATEPELLGVQADSENSLSALLDTTEGQGVVLIRVAPEPPHLIIGLLFEQAPPESDPLDGAGAIEAAIVELPGDSRLLVAPVGDDGTIGDAALSVDADTSAPIGSAFKLWVLGALADAVTAGEVAWNDELMITAADKSLPSGVLQDCPDGSTATVEQAATLMISISDNTATDLLIGLVGVDAVEAQMTAMGVSDEAIQRTLPLLTTNQMFRLKLGDPELLAEYAAATTDERRELLAALPDTPLEVSAASIWSTPLEIDTVEWFASPTDLGNSLIALDELATQPGLEPLDTILGTNPGFEADPAVWTRAWYKGGSEPGVLALAWLLTRADGTRFVVTATFSDTAADVDQTGAIAIGDGAIALAAGLR